MDLPTHILTSLGLPKNVTNEWLEEYPSLGFAIAAIFQIGIIFQQLTIDN